MYIEKFENEAIEFTKEVIKFGEHLQDCAINLQDYGTIHKKYLNMLPLRSKNIAFEANEALKKTSYSSNHTDGKIYVGKDVMYKHSWNSRCSTFYHTDKLKVIKECYKDIAKNIPNKQKRDAMTAFGEFLNKYKRVLDEKQHDKQVTEYEYHLKTPIKTTVVDYKGINEIEIKKINIDMSDPKVKVNEGGYYPEVWPIKKELAYNLSRLKFFYKLSDEFDDIITQVKDHKEKLVVEDQSLVNDLENLFQQFEFLATVKNL